MVRFMCITDNLWRIGNILTRDVLKEYLRVLLSLFLGIQGLTEAVLMNYEPIMEPEPVFLRKRSQYRISHLNRSVLEKMRDVNRQTPVIVNSKILCTLDNSLKN